MFVFHIVYELVIAKLTSNGMNSASIVHCSSLDWGCNSHPPNGAYLPLQFTKGVAKEKGQALQKVIRGASEWGYLEEL